MGLLAGTLVALRALVLGAVDSTDPHRAQPERPTVATHAGTVAPGWVEVEMGGQRSEAARILALQTPVVVKVGLAPRAQLGLFVSWGAMSGRGAHVQGFGDAAAGVKWRLVDDAPVVGDFALLPTIKLPTGHSGIGTGTTDVGLLLISSHEIGPVSLDVNVGYTHRSGNGASAPRTATLWTISAGVPVRGALGWIGELSGLPGTNGPRGQRPVVAVLTGPTWTARPWLVFDAGVSPTLRGPQPTYVYAGLTYNIGHL